jgi:5-methylthioadenosine/S-adenosylhomocysteine deaminase
MTDSHLIRCSHALTMDETLGDLEDVDIRVTGGVIAEIGPGLDTGDAPVIGGAGVVALPGFIDAHRHTWQTAVRHCAVGWDLGRYQMNVQGMVGMRLTPQDAYLGNLLGALGALDAGITTIRDESHAQNSPEHTDALIRGLRDSGIRARFAYGWPSTDAMQWLWDSTRTLPDDIIRVRNRVLDDDAALVTLNAHLRGPELSTIDVTRTDVARARDLGVRISMHMGTGEYGDRYHGIRRLRDERLIGPDMTFVHCCTSDDEELDAIADFGAHACVTALVEATMPGLGMPAMGRLLARGVRPSLGVDVEVSTAGDMFNVMRATLMSERLRQTFVGPQAAPVQISAHDLLEFATLRGAMALGLQDTIGSITVGKQADIILVRHNALNLAPTNDPAGSLLAAGHPGNVDTVLVAGRVVKHDGALLRDDVPSVLDRAGDSGRRLLAGIPR